MSKRGGRTTEKKLPEDNEVSKDKKVSILDSYNAAVAKHPFLVNAIQAAVLGGLGTYISEVIKGAPVIDTNEIFIMILINALFNTPILLRFCGFLEKMKGGVIPKLLVDQLLFSPVFTAAIIALRLFLIGTKVDSILPIVKDIVPKAMKSSWLFWFPQRYLTLSYVPPQHQLLCGNVCALVWNVIFSMILTSQN